MEIFTICLLGALLPAVVTKMCPIAQRLDINKYHNTPSYEKWHHSGCICPGQYRQFFLSGRGYDATCEAPLPKEQHKMSTGCRCKEGYFRGRQGGCTTLLRCKENGEYATSMEALWGSCRNNPNEETVLGPNGKCSGFCHTPFPNCQGKEHAYCQCKKGFYIGPDGKCISEKECKAHGLWPKNPEKELEKPDPGSDDSWTNTIHRRPPKCTKQGEELVRNTLERARTCARPNPRYRLNTPFTGCRCKAGLFRDRQSNCLTEDQCREKELWMLSECDNRPNQVYVEGGAGCPATCTDPFNGACHKAFVSGCVCKRGFYMTPKGECVSQGECVNRGLWNTARTTSETMADQQQCPRNEEYRNGCSKVCAAPNRKCKRVRSGCHCKRGYFRVRSGECVTKETCEDRGLWRKAEN